MEFCFSEIFIDKERGRSELRRKKEIIFELKSGVKRSLHSFFHRKIALGTTFEKIDKREFNA